MSYKGLVFAAAALAGAFASTAASALPGSAGLASKPADTAVIKVHFDYSGYHYASHRRDAGYGSVRPSFWGYPALWLPGEPKVIATADEIQWAHDHEYRRGRRSYDEPGLLGIPGALIGGMLGAVSGAFDGPDRGNEYFDQPDDDEEYYGSGYDREQDYGYAHRGPGYDRERGYGSAYRRFGYDREPGYGSAYRGVEYRRESGYVSAYYRGSEYYPKPGYVSAYRGSGYDREPGYSSAYRGSEYYRRPGYGSAYRGSEYYSGAVRSSGWGD